jgi:3-phenylpropionate/cinnamic acid dioxygenase small subunit
VTTAAGIDATLYAEVQSFYAHHMQLLDAGDAAGWAETFTEDGTFLPPSLPEPVRGRAALTAGVRRSAAELAGKGEVHRHCVLMPAVTVRSDGALTVRSYTQIIATRRDEQPRLHLMCVCEDVLVRENGVLKVRERRVTRDDRP